MRFSRFCFLILSVVLFFSCSKPPEEAARIPFLQSLEDFMNSDEHPGSLTDLFYSFRVLADTDDLVSSLYKDDVIIMTGISSVAKENTITHTTGLNRLYVPQRVILTGDKKRRLFFTFNGTNWFPLKNHQRKGEVNVAYDYPLNPLYRPEQNELEIEFQWIAGKSISAREIEMDEKSFLPIHKAGRFYGSDDVENSLDLSQHFIEIPEGTELTFFITFSGNLINSSIEEGKHIIKILRDFHIYTSNDSDWKMGISLDGEKWNFNPLRIHYDMTEYFYSPSPGKLEYHRNMDIRLDY